jgi:isopenicillin N synthase-like dioxygenase
MIMDFKSIFEGLQKNYYISLPLTIDVKVIQEAIQAFLKFLDEPEEVKTHINFSVSPMHRRGDVGFKRRDPSEDIYNDSKDFFHFHPAVFEKYEEFLEKNPAAQNFMKSALPIWDFAYQTTKQVLSTFEDKFPDLCQKVFDSKEPHILLRFLRYSWSKSGKYLAKPHFDAGSFTLAIAESEPGLRIGSCPENLQLVKHKEKEVIFMLSSNFKKLMDTDQFNPGWHDVIQLNDTVIGKPYARWAIVAFIDGHDVEALPRSETHKWYPQAS